MVVQPGSRTLRQGLDAERAYRMVIGVAVVFLCFMAAYPILHVVAISLTSKQEWAAAHGLIVWPRRPTLVAYRAIIENGNYIYSGLLVSVSRTVVGTVFSLVVTIVVGYTVSRRDLFGRKLLLILFVFTILFSGGLIPTFLIIERTGLLDTFWVYIIPTMVNTWGVLVFKQFFENVPAEIEQSAQIDGAGEFPIMVWIVVPMSAGVIAAIGLFTAVGQWNSWFDALIYIRTNSLKPLQLILRNMFANSMLTVEMGIISHDPTVLSATEESTKMAVAVIGTIPILAVYPFLQKYFIKGVYTGSVKA